MIKKLSVLAIATVALAQSVADPFQATPENFIRYAAFGQLTLSGQYVPTPYAIRIEDLGSRGNPIFHDPRYTNVWRILLVSDSLGSSIQPVATTWADITSQNWADGRSQVILPGFGKLVWKAIDPQIRPSSFVSETYHQRFTVIRIDDYTTEIFVEDPAL